MTALTPILDGAGSFATFRRVFAQASPELEARAREVAPETFRGDAWWLPVRSYLVETEDARVLVDTGLGPQPRDFMAETRSALLEEIDAESIDVVTFTHLHVDHIGWNAAFPKARFVVADDEWQWTLGDEERRTYHASRLEPMKERLDLVTGEASVVPGVRLVPTPGHTPGHRSVVVDTDAGTVVLLGDACLHPVQLLDPDLPYIGDDDPALAARSRRRILEWLADDELLVSVSHFPDDFGTVTRAGDGFTWRRHQR